MGEGVVFLTKGFCAAPNGLPLPAGAKAAGAFGLGGSARLPNALLDDEMAVFRTGEGFFVCVGGLFPNVDFPSDCPNTGPPVANTSPNGFFGLPRRAFI